MNKFYFFLFFFSLKFLASEELLEKEFIEGLVEKKNKEEKKQFLLPQSENLILEPEQTLKEISTHYLLALWNFLWGRWRILMDKKKSFRVFFKYISWMGVFWKRFL